MLRPQIITATFLLMITLGFFIPSTSKAFIEVRGTAGLALPNPTDMNTALGSNGVKQIYVLGLVGVDALVSPFLIPVALGVRYQYGGIKVDSAGGNTQANAELQVSRIAALADFRLIDSAFLFGFVGSFGITHSLNLATTSPLGVKNTFNDSKNTSFSIGAEYGFKLGPILFGGEGGYEYFVAKSLTGPAGAASFDIDLSGFYMLGFVGAQF